MPETGKMVAGLAAAAGVSIAWSMWPQHNQFKLADNPLAVIEHYHIGLISLIAARAVPKKYSPYLDGFGAGLIVSEAGQEQPFGWNHTTFAPSIVIGLTLASILALSI
jgi:hypothetical protein